MFRELLQHLDHRVRKKKTNWRDPISAGAQLAISLRFLATGNSYKDLMYGFRVSTSTIAKIIPEVCEAIIDEYWDEVVATPRTP